MRAVLRKRGTEDAWSGPYLCGCDGAHSAVRHGLGIGFPGGTYDQLFYVADAQADGAWSDRDLTGYIAEKTFCLAFPVRRAGTFRFIGLVPEALRGRDDVQFDDLRGEVEKVTGMRVQRVNWFSTYRVHHRVADRFRQGRVFLAGDAGHVHRPAGGQGMNTGIGDAVNLAWKLAAVLAGRATPGLLDTYEAERVPFAQSLVATTDRTFEGVVGRGFLARMVRTVFFPFILPFALRFAAVRRMALDERRPAGRSREGRAVPRASRRPHRLRPQDAGRRGLRAYLARFGIPWPRRSISSSGSTASLFR